MSQLKQIFSVLADGRFHSGEELGAILGVTRSAVWQTLNRLIDPALDLQAVRGRGYRIPGGLELLDSETIYAQLQEQRSQCQIEICDSVASTNQYLLNKHDAVSGTICLAEQQTMGRGRRGRNWFSPFGRNIYLSLLWNFATDTGSLAGLSLAIGVAVLRALQAYGLSQLVGLKWPNDIVVGQKKLGGILLEINGDVAGPCNVVIGIGLNLQMPTLNTLPIDQPWIDIYSLTRQTVQRNRLAGLIIKELLTALPAFQAQGLTPFHTTWQQFDVLQGRQVTVKTTEGEIQGLATGIDYRGNLLVQNANTLHNFHSGEVTVRLQEAPQTQDARNFIGS